MSVARTPLSAHYKKAWTFTNGHQVRVVTPSTDESPRGLLTLGTVIAVNTSAKFKLSPADPSSYVVKLTVEHGTDQQRVYALDPVLYLIDGNDTHKDLKEGYKLSRDMPPSETATRRWSKWIGPHTFVCSGRYFDI